MKTANEILNETSFSDKESTIVDVIYKAMHAYAIEYAKADREGLIKRCELDGPLFFAATINNAPFPEMK